MLIAQQNRHIISQKISMIQYNTAQLVVYICIRECINFDFFKENRKCWPGNKVANSKKDAFIKGILANQAVFSYKVCMKC